MPRSTWVRLGMTLLVAQLTGIGAVAVYTLVVSLVFWLLVKGIFGLRVSAREEDEGLDIGEHGQVAYIIPPSSSQAMPSHAHV